MHAFIHSYILANDYLLSAYHGQILLQFGVGGTVRIRKAEPFFLREFTFLKELNILDNSLEKEPDAIIKNNY